ncbi:MAG: DUF5671 domain-containing protein [Vicinamibacterales bacterium]|nr:DUF5671 domain-containing protein [Vicinamibacterales bacterium]
MTLDESLVAFVKDGLTRGVPRSQIEDALRQAGWPADQATAALASFAEVDFPIPVPRPRPYLSAREAFMYLVLFSTLYISSFNLGHLLFLFIDRALPDPTTPIPAEVFRGGVRWSVSFLIVAFPVFTYVSWLTSRATQADPSKHASKIRRWLTYLTLFLAGGVLVGDVTALVYNLLGGELTVRFVLKVAVVGGIAGGVYGYYLGDRVRISGGQIAIGAAAVAVVAAVIGGLLVLGSPGLERARRLDDRRVRDLREIARSVDLHWTRTERLPASLEELSQGSRTPLDTADPETAQPYDYRVTGADTYELCANFELDSEETPEPPGPYFWSHDAGRQCFALEAEEVEL